MNQTAINKIEALLENFGNENNRLGRLTTLGTVGGLGYNLGTGNLQKAAKYLWETPFKKIGKDISTKTESLSDDALNTNLGDLIDKGASLFSDANGE